MTNPPVPPKDAPIDVWIEYVNNAKEINAKELTDKELILCKEKTEQVQKELQRRKQLIFDELRRRNKFYELKQIYYFIKSEKWQEGGYYRNDNNQIKFRLLSYLLLFCFHQQKCLLLLGDIDIDSQQTVVLLYKESELSIVYAFLLGIPVKKYLRS